MPQFEARRRAFWVLATLTLSCVACSEDEDLGDRRCATAFFIQKAIHTVPCGAFVAWHPGNPREGKPVSTGVSIQFNGGPLDNTAEVSVDFTGTPEPGRWYDFADRNVRQVDANLLADHVREMGEETEGGPGRVAKSAPQGAVVGGFGRLFIESVTYPEDDGIDTVFLEMHGRIEVRIESIPLAGIEYIDLVTVF